MAQTLLSVLAFITITIGHRQETSTPADENRFCWGTRCLCHTSLMAIQSIVNIPERHHA